MFAKFSPLKMFANLWSLTGAQAAARTSGARFGRNFSSLPFSPRPRSLLIVLAAGASLIFCTALAQESSAPNARTPLTFDIPSQPLASALQAYGQRTGVQVLYESSSANGRRSAALTGDFTPDAALTVLLSGTDLKVRYIRPNAITLTPSSADGDLPPAHPFAPADLSLDALRVEATADDGDRARRDYSEIVQSDVEGALRKNAKTRSGSYRFGVDLWVDSTRTVRRAELFQSTGDRNRDAAVSVTLQGLLISQQAPMNTPSPVHVFVVVRSLR